MGIVAFFMFITVPRTFVTLPEKGVRPPESEADRRTVHLDRAALAPCQSETYSAAGSVQRCHITAGMIYRNIFYFAPHAT